MEARIYQLVFLSSASMNPLGVIPPAPAISLMNAFNRLAISFLRAPEAALALKD